MLFWQLIQKIDKIQKGGTKHIEQSCKKPRYIYYNIRISACNGMVL